MHTDKDVHEAYMPILWQQPSHETLPIKLATSEWCPEAGGPEP